MDGDATQVAFKFPAEGSGNRLRQSFPARNQARAILRREVRASCLAAKFRRPVAAAHRSRHSPRLPSDFFGSFQGYIANDHCGRDSSLTVSPSACFLLQAELFPPPSRRSRLLQCEWERQRPGTGSWLQPPSDSPRHMAAHARRSRSLPADCAIWPRRRSGCDDRGPRLTALTPRQATRFNGSLRPSTKATRAAGSFSLSTKRSMVR